MKSIIVALLLAACSPMSYTHGVPNLAQVDSNVWRSGQITTQEGWDYIAKLANGRRVHVIKLNYIHEGSDGIALEVEPTRSTEAIRRPSADCHSADRTPLPSPNPARSTS